MAEYILGKTEQDLIDGTLTEYPDVVTADGEAYEWVKVKADTIEEAQAKYERAFFDWQVSQELAKPGDWEETTTTERS